MSDAPERTGGGDTMTEPEVPPSVDSITVIIRFFGRLLVIVLFAAVSQNRFSQTFIALLGMIIAICAAWGLRQRENPFERHLTHWDECAAYALLASLTHVLAN